MARTRLRVRPAPTTVDETIQTTTNHPWLTAGHGWILASFLRFGESVQRMDGATAVVVAVQAEPGAAAMWDLTVSTVHTFAVGSGAYVVHNCLGDSAKVDMSDEKSIQHTWKHAKDFGVTENYTKGSTVLRDALVDHLEDPDTMEIPGTYRGQAARHFYNPRTDLNLIADGGGKLVSTWKLKPLQVWNLITRWSL